MRSRGGCVVLGDEISRLFREVFAIDLSLNGPGMFLLKPSPGLHFSKPLLTSVFSPALMWRFFLSAVGAVPRQYSGHRLVLGAPCAYLPHQSTAQLCYSCSHRLEHPEQ